MKKKIIGIIIAIIIIFVGIIAGMVTNELKQEKKLSENIIKINNLIEEDNINYKKVKKELKTYVTNGNTLMIEKAVKDYYLDYFDAIIKFEKIVNTDKINKLVSMENIMYDAKDFINTKRYITSTEEKLDDLDIEVLDLLSDDTIMSYTNDNFDDYDTQTYKELISTLNYFGTKKSYEKASKIIKNSLNKINNMVTFLSENKENWTIYNDTVIFSNKKLSDEFNKILDDFEEIELSRI